MLPLVSFWIFPMQAASRAALQCPQSPTTAWYKHSIIPKIVSFSIGNLFAYKENVKMEMILCYRQQTFPRIKK